MLLLVERRSDSILSSDAGQVLSKYSVNISEPITKHEIDELRSKAIVTCNGYTPPSGDSLKACDRFASPCLFHIVDDPCETTNLASELPEIVATLKAKLDYYGNIAKPIRNKPADSLCDPANFGGVWTWWYDELNITTQSSGTQCLDSVGFRI